MTNPVVRWNPEIKLILADVDQTLADDFMPAEPEMIDELTSVAEEGHALFLVTGGPLNRLRTRLIDRLPARARSRVLVSHCSGAEVWGFDEAGELRAEPFYSFYDSHVNDEQKKAWRVVIDQLVDEFKFTTYPPQPLEEFWSKAGDDPFAVILEDRGPQITFELINAHTMSKSQGAIVKAKLPHLEEVIDLREPLCARAAELLIAANVPVTPRLASIFALDIALEGVSKAHSVEAVLGNQAILQSIGLTQADLADPKHLEIWGDRFDQNRGTDWLMCKAVNPRVRAIDFRQDENPANFPPGYNIVIWPGAHQLHTGALEYLQSRHAR